MIEQALRERLRIVLVTVLVVSSASMFLTSLPVAKGELGLVKSYGPNTSSLQPYEPAGPWIDGVIVPDNVVSLPDAGYALPDSLDDPPTQLVISPGYSQFDQWILLKYGALDVYDTPLLPIQVREYNSNLCVSAPNAPSGIAPCPSGQAPIQTQIGISAVDSSDKYQIDFENGNFPSNFLAFRQAVAWVLDKEYFVDNYLSGWGYPIYTSVPCPLLCDQGWVVSSLATTAAENNNTYGSRLPSSYRATVANKILDSAGFSLDSSGLRVDNAPGCGNRTIPRSNGLAVVNDCNQELQPVFYVQAYNANLQSLGRYLRDLLQNTLHISTVNYHEDIPLSFSGPVNRGLFNLATGSWLFNRDPLFLYDLYDSKFIPWLNNGVGRNYVDYSDALFDADVSGLVSATDVSAAMSFAHKAELEYNFTLPVLDVWTDRAPHAYRLVHQDSDPALNGLRWSGVHYQKGGGFDNGWTWLNAALQGAPLHDPKHPVLLKWGWSSAVLDRPNPIDSAFAYDRLAFSLSYDTLNNLATDDLGFTGDLPWMASLPTVTTIASGATFPNGGVCTPIGPATSCSVWSYQLRSDLTFAASLDGKIPALGVTASDVRFSILLARDSPTSFVSASYASVQDVVASDPFNFQVYERNNAMWDRHNLGATTILSIQHWCQEAHDSWPGSALANCLANPVGSGLWPDLNANVLSSGSGNFVSGSPVGLNLGSGPFVYDSENSNTDPYGPFGPRVYWTRQTPGLHPAGYGNNPVPDSYFTSLTGGNSGAIHIGGWRKFHFAGNVNWYCTQCPSGPSEAGPLPSPDMAINIVDLSIVSVHFGESPGLGSQWPFYSAPWDISGPNGTPDGVVNIFDMGRVSAHFGQSFLGGTDLGGGAEGSIPGWVGESIPGT